MPSPPQDSSKGEWDKPVMALKEGEPALDWGRRIRLAVFACNLLVIRRNFILKG
jgi:hypothetical protein